MHGVSHVRPDEEDMYLTPPPTHYGVNEAIKAIGSSPNNKNNNSNRFVIFLLYYQIILKQSFILMQLIYFFFVKIKRTFL